jgi:hypothetical protein
LAYIVVMVIYGNDVNNRPTSFQPDKLYDLVRAVMAGSAVSLIVNWLVYPQSASQEMR